MCFQLSNLKQFDSWTFQQSFFMDGIYGQLFVFNPNDQRLKMYVEVYDGIVSILNFERHSSSSAALQIQWWSLGPTVLSFFWDFFWRSGLSESWIQSYVLGYCFGCSLRPGTPINSPWNSASSVLLLSLTLAIKARQSWLPRPYAWPSSSYPQRGIPAFLSMEIKLLCVCPTSTWTFNPQPSTLNPQPSTLQP